MFMYPQGEFAQMAFEREFDEMLSDGVDLFDPADVFYGDSYRPQYRSPTIRRTVTSTTINYNKVHETEKALLLNDGNGNFWIPKSVFTKVSDFKGSIPDWFKPSYLEE